MSYTKSWLSTAKALTFQSVFGVVTLLNVSCTNDPTHRKTALPEMGALPGAVTDEERQASINKWDI